MFTPFQPFTKVAEPFAIGLKPVDPKTWIYRNADFQNYLQQKLALYETKFQSVFVATEDSLKAQQEVEDFIKSSLPTNSDPPKLPDLPPLAKAALNVQDDLVLMRKKEDGWNLIAGSVCFPAHWSLTEKFNRPLESIHGPVPMNEKMHQRINRIFSSLQPSIPVWRENWSLDSDDGLRKEKLEHVNKHKSQSTFERFFYRTEYQTLHKLPVSGDVLFTIGTYITHLGDMKRMENGPEMLSRFRKQIMELSAKEADYKGITHCRQSLIDWLSEEIESAT